MLIVTTPLHKTGEALSPFLFQRSFVTLRLQLNYTFAGNKKANVGWVPLERCVIS